MALNALDALAGALAAPGDGDVGDVGDFPDLVYSVWMDTLYPCRIVATSGAEVLIVTPLSPRRLRVPRRLIFRRAEIVAALGVSDGQE